MSVFRRGRHSAVRWAIGLGVLAAFPFVSSGVAQAAMAGANPLTTNNRPDLRTVHVNSSLNTAQFCFDKTLTNQKASGGALLPGDWTLGGYRFDVAATMSSINVQSSNTNCAVGTVSPKTTYGGARDLKSYSFGSVDDGAVIPNGGGGAATGNIGDSTANLDSNSNNGTADHTTGPDFIGIPGGGIGVDTTQNRIIFSFDQPTRHDAVGLAQGACRFNFYDGNGTIHYGVPVQADSLGNVQVQYGNSGSINAAAVATAEGQTTCAGMINSNATDSVSLARLALAMRLSPQSTSTVDQSVNLTNAPEGNPNNSSRGGAIQEQAGEPQTDSPTESQPIPGTSGFTSKPDLTGAALVPSGPSNQIDYSFSIPVTANNASDFVAVMSNGREIQANSANVISSNVVRATFSNANFQNIEELAVKASVYNNPQGICSTSCSAVNSVNTINNQHPPNTTGGVSVGDNAGAFATGFSTGPDAQSVSFSKAGQVVIQFDQRVDPNSLDTSAGNFQLLAADGTVIANAPSSASVFNNTPFTSQVTLTYPPADLFNGNGTPNAVALLLEGPPVDGSSSSSSALASFQSTNCCLTENRQGNVRQVISPTASAAAFYDPAKGKIRNHWTRYTNAQRRQAVARLHRRHRR